MRTPVYLVVKANTPFAGANTNAYFYETEVEKHSWLAEIEEDVMFEPENFEIDSSPCGHGFKDKASLQEYLASETYDKKPAIEVGYIEDGKLVVTKQIKVETGWGGFSPMLCTSYEYIYPNSKKSEAKHE